MKARTLACALLLGVCGATSAQWNTLGGNTITLPTEYLGCDALSTQPLRVKTEANQPIEWYTDNIPRMKLFETVSGSLPLRFGPPVSVPRDGFVGISGTPGFLAPGGYGPFTRLHLADLDPSSAGPNFYAQPWGFRSWMRNGITFTGNHDHSYVGQKYGEVDETDMIIHWSDNPNK